jgi:hemolysin activation/secretion protein
MAAKPNASMKGPVQTEFVAEAVERTMRTSKPVRTFLFMSALTLLLTAVTAFAQQVLPRIDPTGRSGDRRPDLLEEAVPPPSPPSLTLPPPPLPMGEGQELCLDKVFVRSILVTGNTVFAPEGLSEITGLYENRWLTSEDLEDLRRALTLRYVNAGYINSGAILPDQTVREGVITLQIVEGVLSQISVEGNKWFRESYIRERIEVGASSPVNVNPLQQRLQLLQQDNRIRAIHAELRPGVKPGEAVLKVNVEEKTPFYAWLAFNNYQSPSVGAERGLLTLAHQNLTGHGDILSLTLGRSEGLNPQIDVWYLLPVTVHDTTLLLRYRKNDYAVIDEIFEPLDTRSESDIYEITLRHPLIRTHNHEFALALTGESLQDKTFLLGEPFSFYPGVENGESKVTALRFSQEWTYRTQREVVAARSRFSFGIDALEATTHSSHSVPDGKFLAWLGQFQWARAFKTWDMQLLFRTDAQITNQPLLPLEQIAVGGRYTVRGYRENLLVRDQAFIASVELRIPIVRNAPWAEDLQLVPFSDYGYAKNRDLPSLDPRSIYSVGLGLRWGVPLMKSPAALKLDFEFYWGYALKDVSPPDHNIQDEGIHFQIAVTGF